MRMLIILLAVLIPADAMAQEMAERERNWVILKDDNGTVIGRVNPTPQFALDAIQARQEWRHRAALAVLRQTIQTRSATELDAFADDLKRLALRKDRFQGWWYARVVFGVLRNAAYTGSKIEGIPYERGLEVLIEIYEAYEAMGGIEDHPIWYILRDILDAGGEDYLRGLLTSIERPEKPCWMPPLSYRIDDQEIEPTPDEEWCPYETSWCEVGTLLIRHRIAGVDPALVYSLCDRAEMDGNWAFEKEVDGVLVFHKDNYQSTRRVIPTPQYALDAIQAEKVWAQRAARVVLRQVHGPRSAAELDAFADELGRLMLESSWHMRARYVVDALRDAADLDPANYGIPYERGLEVLIETYEAMNGTEAIGTKWVMRNIFYSGGEDYVRELFESSEPPEKQCVIEQFIVPGRARPLKKELCPYEIPWCAAGGVLAGVGEVDPILVYPICDKRIGYKNGTMTFTTY